jgi:PASTA domain
MIRWLIEPLIDLIPDEWFGGGRPAHRAGRGVAPDVRGLTVQEARSRLAREGFRPEVVRLEDDPAPEMGLVVDQHPAPGARHRFVRPVRLMVLHREDPSGDA